jgi:hypothetical protein
LDWLVEIPELGIARVKFFIIQEIQFGPAATRFISQPPSAFIGCTE